MAQFVLPDLAEEYAVSSGQTSQYQRDGHILLRGVASHTELAAFLPFIRSAVERFNIETRPLEERDTYGKAFLQVMNLWQRDEAVRRFVSSRRFAKIAADLMGVGGVRLYHDQALYKEPGGGKTPWHQDQYYWPLDTDKTITMWMPLVDVSAEMGTMLFASGSQQHGYLGKLPISDESDEVFKRFIADRGYNLFNAGAMAGGDATFHSGWILHGAPGNQSARAREVMTIIYFADGARVTEAVNPNQERDMTRWLPGLKPGDVAASALNPLVYSSAREQPDRWH
jgi:ectoine hydroxylase-related dioxygenase (phytanoyl-CoA dioxygenase family)